MSPGVLLLTINHQSPCTTVLIWDISKYLELSLVKNEKQSYMFFYRGAL
jgi:hypothetical protein